MLATAYKKEHIKRVFKQWRDDLVSIHHIGHRRLVEDQRTTARNVLSSVIMLQQLTKKEADEVDDFMEFYMDTRFKNTEAADQLADKLES